MKNENMSSLRDLRWASGSYFSINISSLREYIRKSGTDDMFNIIIIQPTQKKLNYDTPKNNIAPMWVPFFTNNISSLRDLRWASGYFFSINISSLREYIRKSRRDGMFIKTIQHINHLTNSPINHSTNSPLNHIPFHQPTPLTYARIL